MKKIYLILIINLFCIQLLTAQKHTEKIVRELSFEKKSPENALMIANINGDVKIEGYEGDKILVEVTKIIIGKTETRLEKGKRELRLGVIDKADTIILYVDGTCNTFSKVSRRRGNDRRWSKNWNYGWYNNDDDCYEQFEYSMNFVVKVPFSTNVLASTINDGDVVVENMKGSVSANNINGNIRLANLVREADASTINGDVDIVYVRNPAKDCRFYSLNGDINALFQKGLAANLSFESFNGEFFTDVKSVEALPLTVEKANNKEGIKYKVNANRYKIGAGGILLDFETFNGNVYLKEKIN